MSHQPEEEKENKYLYCVPACVCGGNEPSVNEHLCKHPRCAAPTTPSGNLSENEKNPKLSELNTKKYTCIN